LIVAVHLHHEVEALPQRLAEAGLHRSADALVRRVAQERDARVAQGLDALASTTTMIERTNGGTPRTTCSMCFATR
jgi:hypothetical protein